MKIKLSTLIAAGAKLWPQAFGRWNRKNNLGETERCALDAAKAVINKGTEEIGVELFDEKDLRRLVKDAFLHCPECKNEINVFSLVMHLNDTHKWPRERIADFLAKKGH